MRHAFISFKKLAVAAAVVLVTSADAAMVVIALDNSASTMENREAIAKQCAAQYTDAVRYPQVNQVQLITIGSAKNPSMSEFKKIGPRDYGDFMTRDNITEHFKNQILAFPKRLENGTVRLDGSSGIYNGVFYDAAALFRMKSGSPPTEGTLIVCSDFIENEIVTDITKMALPSPPSGALQNIRVYGIGIGLGLDSSEQNTLRETWIKAMQQAGANFIPLKIR